MREPGERDETTRRTNEDAVPTDAATPAEDCPICGGPRYGVHCKVICENCGYREDCSDIFPVD